VRFLARGAGYGLALTRAGAILVLHKRVPGSRSLGHPRPTAKGRDARLALGFLGASPRVRVVGGHPLAGKVNYLLGNDPSKWLRGVRTFGEARYQGLYPGIDARFYGRQGRLEYDLVVAPGADPGRIGLALGGADDVHLDARGRLRVRLSGRTLIQPPPRIYQTIAGHRQPVAGGYLLTGRDRFRFRLGAYDHGRPLVIDPVLAYSTYLGGSGADFGAAIAVDGAGSAYVTGRTDSEDFPTTPGALDTSFLGPVVFCCGSDAFVTKLAPSGASLVYSTYLGGTQFDGATGIAVDASGSAYLTGATDSADFPTTPGALDTSYPGALDDSFVAKLAPDGASLVYSTFLGGSGVCRRCGDYSDAIAVDASGSAYLTGSTGSADFPTTPDAFDRSFNGIFFDAFVAKLAPDGASLVYSTYLGGRGGDSGSGIAIDASGSAYLAGFTDAEGFPTTPDAFDRSFNGGFRGDAFVAKLAPNGASLVYSTYLGGSDTDAASAIAVDHAGAAYATGFTYSSDFPTTPGVFDTSPDSSDAFVSKLAPDGASLVYSTSIGRCACAGPPVSGIAVDASGSAYLTGATDSADFPTTPDAFDRSFNGGLSDAFVTKLASNGASLVYSTFLGGSTNDYGVGIAVDTSGGAYVAGTTGSADFPTTPGAFDRSFNGPFASLTGFDIFVTKLELVAATLTLNIDIKPGSTTNPINLRSKGVIPVAILSTDSFDATTVDPASVCFGDADDASQRDCTEAHAKGHLDDVNGDGRLDLLLHFETQQTGIDPGDTTACLNGKTFTGTDVAGCDAITTL
jgi:hypothetical protein